MRILGVVLILFISGCNEPPKTPPTKTLDPNTVIEQCMTSGHRVGECMKYLSWEA